MKFVPLLCSIIFLQNYCAVSVAEEFVVKEAGELIEFYNLA